jgi:hypothetical protein
MRGAFSFDLNAIRARDEINDALNMSQRPNMGQAPADPNLLQQLSQRVNVQATPKMQQMNVNAPLGGGFSANLGVGRMGSQPNMPASPPQMTNVGVGYQSPGFSADIGYNPAQKGVGASLRMPFKRGGKVSSDDFAVKRDEYASGGGAWTRKEGKNPEGGLNAKGRASLKAQGQDIKPPVSAKQAAKSPKSAARRKSFCARMGGMEGPMKDESGKPTRKALALRKWDCKAEGGLIEVEGRRIMPSPDLLSLDALSDFRLPAQDSGGGGGSRMEPMPDTVSASSKMPFASTAGYVGPTLRGDRFQVSVGPGRRGSVGVGGRLQFAEGGESRVNEAGNYTKPTMRKSLFNSIKAGGKGGAPGQWSARKAQMLAQQYKAKGGGYRD